MFLLWFFSIILITVAAVLVVVCWPPDKQHVINDSAGIKHPHPCKDDEMEDVSI